MISLEKILALEVKGINQEEYIKLILGQYREGAYSPNVYRSDKTKCFLLSFHFIDECLEFYVVKEDIAKTKIYIVRRFGSYKSMEKELIDSPMYLFNPSVKV